jgi:hypothetical protein
VRNSASNEVTRNSTIAGTMVLAIASSAYGRKFLPAAQECYTRIKTPIPMAPSSRREGAFRPIVTGMTHVSPLYITTIPAQT